MQHPLRKTTTEILSEPVSGRRMVRRLNVDGDGQGDLAGHGGEHRAVLVYQIESYRYWEGQLGRSDFRYGQFGENFTVEGLAEDGCLDPLQELMMETGGVQCGFCTPGFIVSLTGYLINNDVYEIDKALNSIAGNICRCTGYNSIIRALTSVANGEYKEKK